MQINRVSTLLFIALLLAACGTTTGRLLLQGNQAFQRGDYDAALRAYRQAQERTPTDAAPIYNMANTFYRQEVYTQTQQLMPHAISLAEGELLQHGQYNRGNAHFQTQDWDIAIDAYKAALRLNPNDQDAKYNLELALQQQQQNPQKEGQKDGDQNDEAGQGEENQEQQDSGQDSSEENEQNSEEQSAGEQSQEEQAEEQPEEESSQEQSNEEQNSDEQNSDEQNDEEQEGEQSEQNQPQQAQPAQSASQSSQQSQPTQGLTEEQARQLLQIVGQSSDTLQEQMQQRSAGSAPPPEKDW